jgi:hypothetical protein
LTFPSLDSFPNGTSPTAAKTSGSSDYGGELSYLVGQRVSACTCSADASEHPGPSVSKGRGAPESATFSPLPPSFSLLTLPPIAVDILEGQIAPNGKQGSASQSIQIAPFDPEYLWRNDTAATDPGLIVWNSTITTQNTWKGSISQESASLNTLTDSTSYDGAGYTTYGVSHSLSLLLDKTLT